MGTVNCFYVFFLSFSFFKFCFLSRLFNGDSQVLQILQVVLWGPMLLWECDTPVV